MARDEYKQQFLDFCYKSGALKFGDFTLKSGRKSEIDFFNGHLIKLAKQYNLSAEENKRVIRDFKNIKK